MKGWDIFQRVIITPLPSSPQANNSDTLLLFPKTINEKKIKTKTKNQPTYPKIEKKATYYWDMTTYKNLVIPKETR